MTLSPSFRISTYLPLGLATIALGYAEASLLPEVGVFAVGVLIALGVIYRLETKMRALTSGETNRLGICIGVAAVLWAGFRIVREVKTSEFASLGWVAFLVALVAPVLLALMCALLIRPEKKLSDYWFMQGAGLAAIVLAGAMVEQTVMVALTALYALCIVWFLSEFHLSRLDAKSGSGRLRLPRAMLWLVAAATVAVPLYLLTPRSPFDKLEFGQGRIEIGYAADQMIDLTQTGDLKDNPETAFEVQATLANGQPKEDLDPNQRWRGAVLVNYAAGTWRRDIQALFPTAPADLARPVPWSPPDFGPETFQLRYTVPPKLRSRFLLDPVVWEPGRAVPIAELTDAAPQPWMPLSNGRVFGRNPAGARTDEKEFRYVQYSRPLAEPDLSPAYSVTLEVNRMLVSYPVPAVKDYTDRILADLVASGKLPAEVRSRDEVRLRLAPHHHELVARALRDHLSERADLTYTTNLKRINKSVDPVEDFLFHSKAGHCERFATALVLMLRSQGIPAAMVLGFKGAEHAGGGKYLVRQEFAHAWAEALISRPNPDPKKTAPLYHWLSLDPSPTQDRSDNTEAAGSGWSWAAFERFIFHNSPEQREKALHWMAGAITNPIVLGGAAGTILAIVLVRRFLRRRTASRGFDRTGWFQRLATALEPHGLVPQSGETAREFALRAQASLPPDDAEVPRQWVELHYRERFGSAVINPADREELEHRLKELARQKET